MDDDLVQRLFGMRLPAGYSDVVLIEATDEITRLRAERDALREEIAAIMQAITDPENQPSQFGTVPLAQYARLRERIDGAPISVVRQYGRIAKVEVAGLPIEWLGKRVALVVLEDGDGR